MSKSVFTGQLYQLRSNSKLYEGAYVAVNGPWDTFGVVTSLKQIDDDMYLNQIRGVKPRKGEKPVANF